jgi:hypothetical protein
LASVIQPFKEYIGKINFTFKLATIDPAGNRTTGITRNYSYLANGGDEAAKFDPWPSDRYMNIWTESYIGRGTAGGIVLAYATPPASGAANPYSDGLISRADATGANSALDNTIEHEIGHFFNLAHTWGGGEITAHVCGDDGVDDTPPTKGHFSTCELYDTACASNYRKSYTVGGIIYNVDFPDTVNTQNIMDYSSCTVMFSVGQAMRMRAAANSTVARRSNLYSDANLASTGALLPTPDLAPIADFSPNKVFVCANTGAPNGAVSFTNRSWRDTVSANAWTFTNGSPATSTVSSPANVTFNQIGWVDASLTSTSNAGSGSITKSHVVYAADPTAIPAAGYYQEFDGGDVDMYPIFNYYNDNNYKWELYNSRGYYDQNCIRFKSFDPRTTYAINNVTQTPGGLFADFFTRGFDLTSTDFANRAILNFYTSGAYRTTNTAKMNDTLEVSYSTTCGSAWVRLGVIARSAISGKYQTTDFVPGVADDWKLQGLTLPAGAKTAKTFFRFRYKPGTDNTVGSTFPGQGTGNNFYLDRLNISSSALGVNNAELASKGVTLAPNPTGGSTMVTIKGGDNSAAQIVVMDIAGKVVYRTEARLTEAATQVEIPAEKISVQGMYLVQVVANGNSTTQKLVVY